MSIKRNKTRRKRRGGMMKTIKHAFGFYTPTKDNVDARNDYFRKKYETSSVKGPFCVVDGSGEPEYDDPDREPLVFTDQYGNSYYIGNSTFPRRRAEECITPDDDNWLNLYELPVDGPLLKQGVNDSLNEKLFRYRSTIKDIERRYINGEQDPINQIFEYDNYEDKSFKENYARYKVQGRPERIRTQSTGINKRDRSNDMESKKLKREKSEGTLSYSLDLESDPIRFKTETPDTDEIMPFRETREEQERNEMGRADVESGIVRLDYIAEGTSKFLNAVCSDSGVCITFGKELKKIKEFFGNFDLRYITETVKRIGVPSVNGFIHEITFIRKEYSAHAVLKSSKNITRGGSIPDNLMYEYRVGLFLNKMALRYPCFLETYNLYAYNPGAHTIAENSPEINAEDFKRFVRPQSYDLNYACALPTQTCILIQHLKGVFSVRELVKLKHVNLNHDLLIILYQIYYVLNAMKSIFTHYDLHSGNILLYEPSPDKYIHYHYHHASGVRSFKCIYVAKIIDYGRCYFNDIDEHISSLNVKASLCAKDACKPKCGYYKGFNWLSNDSVSNYINSSVINSSHDLIFARNLLGRILSTDSSHLDPMLLDILSNLHIDIIYEQDHGTPVMKDCPGKICNVTSMFMNLESIFDTLDLDGSFDSFYGNRTKLGDMNVYQDRPLEFIES